MAQASSASLPLWSSKQSLGVQSPCPASGCVVPERVIFYPELLPLNVIRPLRFMTSWRIQAYVTSYGVFDLFEKVLSGLETHHSPVAVWVGVSKERRTLGSVWCGNRNRNSVEGKSRSVAAMWEHGLSGWWAFAWDWMERSMLILVYPWH